MSKQQVVLDELAKRDKAAKFFLRPPVETSKRFIDYVEWTSASDKLDYGCVLDNALTPPLPGDYISIMARPGHKKTAFMVSLAKRYAQRIIAEGKSEKEVVVYATWDEAVENIESYLAAGLGDFDAGDVAWGRVSKDQAVKASVQRIGKMSPLWVWGVSIMDSEKSKPPFTADWLFSTVQALRHEFGMTVRALFLDYLQIMPVLDEKNRTAEVATASKSAKALGKDIGCPVFAGVQASREADKRHDMVPGWSDAQHASQIEQDSTKQLALSNPIKHIDPGEVIEVGNRYFQVTDDLTIVRILKQRGERGSGTFAVGINPATLTIQDMDALQGESIKLE